MMTSYDDCNDPEFQQHINGLSGDIWKALAISQYNLSVSQGKTHEESVQDVFDIVIETSTNVINSDPNKNQVS